MFAVVFFLLLSTLYVFLFIQLNKMRAESLVGAGRENEQRIIIFPFSSCIGIDSNHEFKNFHFGFSHSVFMLGLHCFACVFWQFAFSFFGFLHCIFLSIFAIYIAFSSSPKLAILRIGLRECSLHSFACSLLPFQF